MVAPGKSEKKNIPRSIIFVKMSKGEDKKEK